MKKTVQARSSSYLFIPPTITAHICCHLYHGGLLDMKKIQALSSNSSQPLPQGGIYWTKVGRRLRGGAVPPQANSSKLFPDLKCINAVKQSMPSSPFLSKLCLPHF